MNRRAPILLILSFLAFQSTMNAQRDELHQFIESGNTPWERLGIRDTAALKEFYRLLEYQPAWTGSDRIKNQAYLLQTLHNAGDEGLEETAYQFEFIKLYSDPAKWALYSEEWIIPEIRLTDAAIQYFKDIAFGNTTPLLSYDGLSYKPGCISVPWQLAKHIQYNILDRLKNVLKPALPEIDVIRSSIVKLRERLADPSYSDELVVSTRATIANKPLLKKLFGLGVLDSIPTKWADKLVVAKVKEAQRLFGLLDDGVIRATFLKELNISLTARLNQLNLSINYYRWLYCLSRMHPVVLVNIPAAYLKVYSEGKSILEMRMIVGKPATPTPTLSSRITEVVLYPYWTVPHSIATNELLPSIKRNPGYIDANNYQVLNKQGKIMDPSTINWSALSPSYFPYIIRQSTGCDNALGLLKLNFYNPFSVYLHDTPTKSLFMLNKRFFSHGCMRLENPMDLGNLVLKENTIAIDTLEEKGCLRNQSPIIVPVSDQLPVIVWYNPAGTNANGQLVYFEDIYNKFSWLKLQ